jgi:anti-sigma regulatory factor (Ser/Thr protein kinase)
LAIGFEGQIIMHTTLVIPATFEALEQLSPLMSQATYAAPARMQAQLALAVHELCMNIVQHAYAGTPGEIRLEVDYSDHSLQISIYDQGPNAYAATEVVEPDPFDLPEHGWGIAIVHRVMDNVYYEHLESGSQWRLIKSW